MVNSVGIIGLGIMGGTFARHLRDAGRDVYGFDVSPAAMARLAAVGGTPCASPAEVAARAELSILSLPSEDALAAVVTGSGGVAASPHNGRIVLEASTLPVAAKQSARDALSAAGHTLLDCPVSGTGAQAVSKDIVVFASGDEAAFAACVPVIEAFARKHVYVGAFGNGSKLKLLANLLVTIHNVAAAEAFALGQKAGLDPALIYNSLADSAGASRMLQVRGPQMVAGRYDEPTFTIANHLKDLRIIDEFRRELGVGTPLFEAASHHYHTVEQQGGAALDTASVCLVAEQLAGLIRPKRDAL